MSVLFPPAASLAEARAAHVRGLLLVFFGGVFYASAGVFARALPYDAWTLLAWRSLAGGLFTGIVVMIERRRFSWRDYAMGPVFWLMVPVGALATACYVVALTITTVANVMIVYATTPFVTAIVAWLWNREVPTPRLMIASGAAVLGVVVMIGGGGSSDTLLAGAALMLIMNVGFAMLLVLARRNPGHSMTPLNTLSLLLASAIGFAMSPPDIPPVGSLLLLFAFGITTVGFAMLLFMAGARVAPSSEVALIGISDVVLGPLMVFALFGENPGLAALIGGAIVMGALLWNVWPEVRRSLRR